MKPHCFCSWGFSFIQPLNFNKKLMEIDKKPICDPLVNAFGLYTYLWDESFFPVLISFYNKP